MLVTNTNQCFCGVRSLNKNGLHVEVIKRDENVVCEIVFKCTIYFHLVVLKYIFDKLCSTVHDAKIVQSCNIVK